MTSLTLAIHWRGEPAGPLVTISRFPIRYTGKRGDVGRVRLDLDATLSLQLESTSGEGIAGTSAAGSGEAEIAWPC